MCIAIVKPKGAKIPDRDILKICFKNNPDGAGFAYNRNGVNYLHKGYFTFSQFYHALRSCNIKDSESALIHFRVATHGNVDRQTCHPFLITDCYDDMKVTHLKTSGNIMIHNGMLALYEKDTSISDSMILSKSLYEMDLNKDYNRMFIELALQNNNKNKLNRLGILYIDNRTDIFGFKQPWQLVDGCYFSNKSYQKTFTRGYKATTQNIQDKFNYNQDEIQSTKVSFCFNRNIGCDNLSKYLIKRDKENYDQYCEDCIRNVKYFNCKFCGHSYYIHDKSKIKKMCKYCYDKNQNFINQKYCNCGEIASITIKNNNNIENLCYDCSLKKTFVCCQCNKRFYNSEQSCVKNVCKKCYMPKHNQCLYCKSNSNLIRTIYSTCCQKCFVEKEGKECFFCHRKYIYTNNKIGDLYFCTKCISKFQIKKIFEHFKTFLLLDGYKQLKLLQLSEQSSEQMLQNVIKMYIKNDFFKNIENNYNTALMLMKQEIKK